MTTIPAPLQERYEIISALPGTSLYSVYSAIERESGDTVEIRQPRVRALEEVSGIEPFRALMGRHQSVHHPHLGRLLVIEPDGDAFWLVYEPARGEQLRGWLGRGLQLDEALQLIAQAASALQALHDAGLVHGDINSRNLYVTPVTGAQLRNGGLAALADSMGSMQASLQIPMPAYMAPEVLRGAEPSPQADIFSLGMALYETLTGRLPFTGNTRDTVRVKQQEGGILPVTRANPTLPPVLDEVIGRALAWDPQERFASAQEMRETLLNVEVNLSDADTRLVVPDESGRQEILDDIARFEPTRISAEDDRSAAFRVCAECLTINVAAVTRCAVCWRDLQDAPIRNRREGESFARRTQRRRATWRWIRRGALAGVALALVALFIYDRGAPPGLLTGPTTTTLTAQAGEGHWATPRGGPMATGSAMQAEHTPEGDLRWSVDLGAEVRASPTVSNGRIFLTTLDARILALSAQDGSVIWEQEAPGPVDTAAVVADDRVFVAFRNSTIQSLDAATGEQVWETRISNPLFAWVMVDDGSLYAFCQNGVIQAFDAGNGDLRWEIDTEGGMSAPPSVSEGLLFVPTEDREILVLVGETGQTRLAYVVRGAIDGSAAIRNGVAIVGGLDGFIRAIDIRAQNLPLEKTVLRWWAQFFIWGMAPFPPAQSGVIWTRSVGEEIRADSAISGNRAYIATRTGDVIAYTMSSGAEIWRQPLQEEPVEAGSPTIVNDTLYIGAGDGSFHALNAATGERLWTGGMGGPISGSPAFADGTIYVVTDNGILYALD